MGIPYLSNHVWKHREQRHFNPAHLAPTIVIDAPNVAINLIRRLPCTPCFGGSLELYHEFCVHFLTVLKACAADVVIVFGNASLAEKQASLQVKISRAREGIKDIHNNHKLTMYHGRRTVSPLGMQTFVHAARTAGIRLLRADCDDDIAVARIAHDTKGLVLSDDSDFCVFDIPGVLSVSKLRFTEFRRSADGSPSPDIGAPEFSGVCFTRGALAAALKIPQAAVAIWATLVGNDFTAPRNCQDKDNHVLPLHLDVAKRRRPLLPRDRDFSPKEQQQHYQYTLELHREIARWLGRHPYRSPEGRVSVDAILAALKSLHDKAGKGAEAAIRAVQHSLDFYAMTLSANALAADQSDLSLYGPDGGFVPIPAAALALFRSNVIQHVPDDSALLSVVHADPPCIHPLPHTIATGIEEAALFVLYGQHAKDVYREEWVPEWNKKNKTFEYKRVRSNIMRYGPDGIALPHFLEVYSSEPPAAEARIRALADVLQAPAAAVLDFFAKFPLEEDRSRLFYACALRYLVVESRKKRMGPAVHAAEVVALLASIVRPRHQLVVTENVDGEAVEFDLRDEEGGFGGQDDDEGDDGFEAVKGKPVSDEEYRTIRDRKVRQFWEDRNGIKTSELDVETAIFTLLYRWMNVVTKATWLHEGLGQPCGQPDPRMALFDGPAIAAALWSCARSNVTVEHMAGLLQQPDLVEHTMAKELYAIVAHDLQGGDDPMRLPPWEEIGGDGDREYIPDENDVSSNPWGALDDE
eukprot:m.69463 g.69463  ORF g.69463 m.69463 type:complete len:751 (-) comp7551_c0_seq2:182-2434(-)